MKLAIIGSRTIENINLEEYIDQSVTEIVSGGARGVDTLARKFAIKNSIKIVEFLPDYKRYGRGATIVRNREIVDYADKILVFWDGESRGSKFVIDYANKINKPCEVVILEP